MNTDKGRGKKGDGEARVWFSPAGPQSEAWLMGWEQEKGEEEIPDGDNGAALKVCPTSGR